jgi:hypothetical protein
MTPSTRMLSSSSPDLRPLEGTKRSRSMSWMDKLGRQFRGPPFRGSPPQLMDLRQSRLLVQGLTGLKRSVQVLFVRMQFRLLYADDAHVLTAGLFLLGSVVRHRHTMYPIIYGTPTKYYPLNFRVERAVSNDPFPAICFGRMGGPLFMFTCMLKRE